MFFDSISVSGTMSITWADHESFERLCVALSHLVEVGSEPVAPAGEAKEDDLAWADLVRALASHAYVAQIHYEAASRTPGWANIEFARTTVRLTEKQFKLFSSVVTTR